MIKSYINFVFRFLFLTLLISGCSENEKHQIINLLDNKLIIPSRYLLNENTLSDLYRGMGVEQNETTFILRIPSEEVASVIPKYIVKPGRELQDDIEILLTVLNSKELSNYSMPEEFRSLKDLWYSESSYKERIIEPLDDKNWYKVYRKSEYPTSFAVLRTNVKGNLPERVTDFWVAHCLILGPQESLSTRCSTFTTLDNILIEFHVSMENLNHIKEIKQFVETTLNSWIVKSNKDG